MQVLFTIFAAKIINNSASKIITFNNRTILNKILSVSLHPLVKKPKQSIDTRLFNFTVFY